MSSIVWRRIDLPGHEHASLSREGAGWRLRGVAVLVHDAQPCRLEYEIDVDERWITRSARVIGSVGPRAIDVRIEAGGGRWALNGTHAPAVDGCLDVDLNFSPSTNLLPIRRLALAIGQGATVRAAWLRFPSFALQPLEQTYTRLDERRYRYESASFSAELLVREDGLPLRYGEAWIAEAEG
jgi:hypothetical protein